MPRIAGLIQPYPGLHGEVRARGGLVLLVNY